MAKWTCSRNQIQRNSSITVERVAYNSLESKRRVAHLLSFISRPQAALRLCEYLFMVRVTDTNCPDKPSHNARPCLNAFNSLERQAPVQSRLLPQRAIMIPQTKDLKLLTT